MNTRNIVNSLKENDQDFEWYPTTDEMLAVVKRDIVAEFSDGASVLDCGAGDGRALKYLTDGDKYAIEKSDLLLQMMDKDIYIVGTDFDQQTLIDKKVDVVFSNPPYSVYSDWIQKIIKEANSNVVYAVIPQRWKDNQKLLDIIESREAVVSVLGSFDFLEADRAARAKVDVIKVTLAHRRGWQSSQQKVDPFDLWFNDNFKLYAKEENPADYETRKAAKESLGDKVRNEVTKGGDLVRTLFNFYMRDMEKLVTTYQSLESVDEAILLELGVSIEGVRKSLQLRISGLKDRYWHELFDNFRQLTDKLTKGSRKNLLETLTSNTHVDFSIENAHAIIIWVIKNANEYFDSQLITAVEFLVDKSSIKLYKSNKNTFGDERWQYRATPKELDKYSLDYRIVTTRTGGLKIHWHDNNVEGLAERAADYLNDLCAIAANIGFDTVGMPRANNFNWDSGIQNTFQYKDIHTGIRYDLFAVRAYKNGNIHIKFNQKFMCRLNVEFGRLKGWIKSPKEASDELDIPIEEAECNFKQNLKLVVDNTLKLQKLD